MPTRIDIFFKNVAAIHAPTTFDGLIMSELDKEDKIGLCLPAQSSKLKAQKIFLVTGSDFTGYVIAAVVAWHEDEGQYYEPSYFDVR